MRNESLIHRYLPGADPAAPTLLLLHGTGGDENGLLDLGRSLAPGSALLSPRGTQLEGGRVTRWFRRLSEGVFDEEDLQARTHELADFVGEAADRYGFEAANVVAVGFSNGANIAAATLLLRPEVLRGAALLRAMVPLAPVKMPDLRGREVWLAAGKSDPLVPQENVARLTAMLREAGAEVTIRWADAGHQLTSEETRSAREWIRGRFWHP